MATIDYKEKYEQALERARQFSEKPYLEDSAGIVEHIFPELKESDDEKIRKELLKHLREVASGKSLELSTTDYERWATWVDKQGEITKEWSEMKKNNIQTELQEMVDLKQKTEQGEQNPYGQRKESDDERIRKEIIATIHLYYGEPLENEAKEMIAWLENQGEQNPVDKIQLGKKYKCIASPRYSTFRIGKIYKPEDKFLCSLMNFCSDCFEPIEGEQKPAYTKEYDFHGIKFIPKFAKGDIIKDKKCGEVSTIEDFSYDTGLYTHTYGQFPITIQDNYEIIAQKPAWSKEDEKIIRRIDSLLYSQCKIHGSEYEEIHNWLKSLRPQNTWKPTEEQIDALEDAIADAISSIQKNMLNSLYTDLKKL